MNAVYDYLHRLSRMLGLDILLVDKSLHPPQEGRCYSPVA